MKGFRLGCGWRSRRNGLILGIPALAALTLGGCAKECPAVMKTGLPPRVEPLDAALRTTAAETYRRELRIRIPIASHGNVHRRRIALSFDDGPHPNFTEPLLDTLDRLHVHATFFVVGKMAERAPYLIQEEARRGHDVANHTYDHTHVIYLTDAEIAREIFSTNDIIRRYTGKPAILFRPPGGRLNWGALRAIRACGMVTVLWTDDPRDYLNPGAPDPRFQRILLKRLLSAAHPGGVILLHDGISDTIAVLPEFIRRLRAAGYDVVPVSELLAPDIGAPPSSTNLAPYTGPPPASTNPPAAASSFPATTPAAPGTASQAGSSMKPTPRPPVQLPVRNNHPGPR